MANHPAAKLHIRRKSNPVSVFVPMVSADEAASVIDAKSNAPGVVVSRMPRAILIA